MARIWFYLVDEDMDDLIAFAYANGAEAYIERHPKKWYKVVEEWPGIASWRLVNSYCVELINSGKVSE
ncbi:MAG: hypothetical protein AAGH90_11360, partial [Pseudomonadota bacterium]